MNSSSLVFRYQFDAQEERAEFFALKSKIERAEASKSETLRYHELTLKTLLPEDRARFWQTMLPLSPPETEVFTMEETKD